MDSPEQTPPALTLDIALQFLKGVGPKRAEALATLGLTTAADLLHYYPRDYLRYSGEKPVTQLVVGEMATIRGTVVQTRQMPRRGRKQGRFEALLQEDGAGQPDAPPGRCVLTWFNPYGLAGKLHPGVRLRAVGKVTVFNNRPQLVQPKYELLEAEADPAPAGAKIEPVYPASENLSSAAIGRLLAPHLEVLAGQVPELLPEAFLAARNFLPRQAATVAIHQPRNLAEIQKARRTLAYHEFYLHQLAVAIRRYHQRAGTPAVPLRTDDKVDARIRALYEFPLTPAQDRVIGQIRKDLASTKPMNRLLQGDVGAGKTVVALYAMLAAAATGRTESPKSLVLSPKIGQEGLPLATQDLGLRTKDFHGHQAALMAPTEILAEQHYLTLLRYLAGKKVQIGLLVGRQPERERAATRAALADGSLGLVVGTHALLTEEVRFKSLALVVIDEQHKFGVEQRSLIRAKALSGPPPHTLVMTATPIPRTLAMTAFGDLDVSVIDQLPPGRHPIHTKMTVSANRREVYQFVASRLKEREQAYVVLPTIDDGELDLRSATSVQQELQAELLRAFRVGLIHGRMERETRQAVMERFREGLTDVLVATTVIEVGVDVPNATVMVVEHADRFGLSQLHQLRGRVGRSTKKSYCVLISDQTTDDGIKRCEAMVRFSSGFHIAEEDLKLRGMGQILGTGQSGRTDFHFAELLFDMDLLGLARRDAFQTIAADPRLLDATHLALRTEVLAKFGETIGLADVG